MIHDICMAKSAGERKVDCCFSTGFIRRFYMAGLRTPDCREVFKPLRDEKTFLNTMMVMNGTLAFDIAGDRDDRRCVGIGTATIFAQGEKVRG